MNKIIASLTCFLLLISVKGQKVPLNHDVYDGWKSISAPAVSDNGDIVTFEINPQQDDFSNIQKAYGFSKKGGEMEKTRLKYVDHDEGNHVGS